MGLPPGILPISCLLSPRMTVAPLHLPKKTLHFFATDPRKRIKKLFTFCTAW